MERQCLSDPRNIYYRCRKEAEKYNENLSSREGAAELLGLSPSTLSKYELGVTKTVPPDAVVMMAELYNAPELKTHYCACECPIGKGMPIATQVNSFSLVTVRMLKAFSQEEAEVAKKNVRHRGKWSNYGRRVTGNRMVAWLLRQHRKSN